MSAMNPAAEPPAPRWTPEALGLSPERYAGALRYLFDRPVPAASGEEWFWDIDEPPFEATPLEWTRIQAVLFANAGTHLAAYTDEQVGMGLNVLMSNSVSDLPFMAIDPAVPQEDAMRMMAAMPLLWRECIGPRLASVNDPIGGSRSRLGFVCYMWFDVWPTFWNVRDQPCWRDATWRVLRDMLATPCREVQVAALHGIGHCGDDLLRREEIDRTVDRFIRSTGDDDLALRNYAEAARAGCVL